VVIVVLRTVFILLSSFITVIVEVHLVYLMNIEMRRAAANPQTKPTDEGFVSMLLSYTSIVTILYYPALKPILIVPSIEDKRLSERWLACSNMW